MSIPFPIPWVVETGQEIHNFVALFAFVFFAFLGIVFLAVWAPAYKNHSNSEGLLSMCGIGCVLIGFAFALFGLYLVIVFLICAAILMGVVITSNPRVEPTDNESE